MDQAKAASIPAAAEHTCFGCGKPRLTTPRCQDCGALATRQSRALKNLGMTEHWKELCKDGKIDRQAFNAKANTLLGSELSKMIQVTYNEVTAETHEVQMIGTGEFLDEPDMKARCKDKPQRLAAILKNARRHYCVVSEITLIEDMKYASSEVRGVKRVGTSAVHAGTEQKVKKTAVPKVKPEPSDQTEKEMKPLADKQIALVEKWCTSLTKVKESLEEITKSIAQAAAAKVEKDSKEWTKYLPPYTMTSAQAAAANVDAFAASLALILENKQVLSFSGVAKEFKSTVEHAKEVIRSAKLQVTEAQKHATVD
jgi:hypothetical protein